MNQQATSSAPPAKIPVALKQQSIEKLLGEEPYRFEADALCEEKVRLLRRVAPLTLQDMVVGQYQGVTRDKKPAHRSYREEDKVAPDSITPTYAAAILKMTPTPGARPPARPSPGWTTFNRATAIADPSVAIARPPLPYRVNRTVQ